MLFRRLIVVFLLTALSRIDAATLKGVIRTNEEDGEPMANVGLVAEGANPTSSDTFGRFTLEFPHKNPGDPVEIIVKLEGYVVINELQLQSQLPARPEDKILTIMICKEADREEMARRFYRLKSDDTIEATYKQELDILKEEHRADAAALVELQRERQQAIAAGEQASEELAKNGPGQSSALYQQAKRLFLEGKIDDAIKLLSNNDQKRLEAVAQAKQAIDTAVNEWLLTAYMQTMRLQFDAAKNTYLQLLNAAPNSFDAHLAYGTFNQKLRRDSVAEQEYTWCLDWAERSGNQNGRADALDGLADIKSSQYSTKDAEDYFDQAIALRRELAKTGDARCGAALANTLLNVGKFYWSERQISQAEGPIQEAVNIYRELRQKDPQQYATNLAEALNNLGVMNRDRNHLEEGREQLQSALDLLGTLAPNNQERYQASVARLLSNLALIDVLEEHFEDAMGKFQEALKIRHQLAEKNWEGQSPDLASTLTNIGSLYVGQENWEDARRSLEEALEIRRALVRTNAARYLPDLATSLDALGRLNFKAGSMGEARKDYVEALQIYYSQAERNPKIFWADVAITTWMVVVVFLGEYVRSILLMIGSLVIAWLWFRWRRKRRKIG
jgi:hypothetical protein